MSKFSLQPMEMNKKEGLINKRKLFVRTRSEAKIKLAQESFRNFRTKSSAKFSSLVSSPSGSNSEILDFLAQQRAQQALAATANVNAPNLTKEPDEPDVCYEEIAHLIPSFAKTSLESVELSVSSDKSSDLSPEKLNSRSESVARRDSLGTRASNLVNQSSLSFHRVSSQAIEKLTTQQRRPGSLIRAYSETPEDPSEDDVDHA
ncbi:hypothetical protein TCAL_10725 [Tigriopus californicus]|uniref:Uncharacterized protein n=1 Tax=Tigriopus californicus TaxID=6832 RepID=A0A553PS44_TIGCA|nr:hypothetical protein TCAL_10725 [Tigriopus californicus]|eukprot:TCALIF_10725-PA protein Name:"Protein of unknown function" AED:0.00 eAED:0.00 QI:23/1/1/1/1/1/2/105/203